MSELAPWRRRLSLLLAVALLGLTVPARAELPQDEEPSAGMMLFDVVFVRPVGLAATVLGTATFLVSLPFTLLSGDLSKAGRTLVADPFLYTFDRPLGQSDRLE